MKEAFKYSFPKTIPILTGYLFLGASFGILGRSQGIPAITLIMMSLFIYAGSMQFATINVFHASFDPIGAIFLTLMVNARHLFYGITMLPKYSPLKWEKWYAVFGLTDETFSLNVSLDIPENLDEGQVFFIITALNQSYWVGGTILGLLLSRIISFSTEGIEFVLTALFVTIFVEQWLSTEDHLSAISGLVLAIISLFIFGPAHFLIPSMILLIIFFLLQYILKGGRNDDL